ncbi:hypothetical protein N9U83_05180 [Candidatus Pelagibacter sp.]|nr:hypothetical protein [Candidatus Pelagibacter sp.]
MKKYLYSFLVIFLFSSPLHADKLLKSGFISGEWKLNTNFEVKDPKNKILIIFNHGQEDHDKPSKDCVWKNNIRNFASLSGQKVKDKEVLVYLFCTDHLAGDDWKRLWKKNFDFPYKGITKLDKRVNANLDLVKKFVELGVPKNQIFLAGQSCGGWATMMLISKYPDKVAGGISTHHACYGKLSKKYKVKKVGIEKALENFKKKKPGPAVLRENQIKEISKAKSLPVLVFTHPKDPYDGLLSDWVEEIPGAKRIVISEDFKINNKNCSRIGINNGERWEEKVKNAHYMALGDCFQYFNPTILDFIESKI